jgi:hypothetical protein
MRNTYKVLSWDTDTGRGLVTDNTKWDGELQTIVVEASDLGDDAYLQGRLFVGEYISAEEDMNRCANRKLTDILVENGPRSIPERMILGPEGSDDSQAPFNPDPPPTSCLVEDIELVARYEFNQLEARVTALEKSRG